MCDPLSASASLVAFIGAAVASVKTSAEILGGFRYASAEIDALARTCRDLTEVLASLENLQKSVSRLPTTAIAQTAISEAYLNSFTSDLKNLSDVSKFLQTQMASKSFGKQLAKLRWSLNKKRKVMQCNERMQHHKFTLILALNVFQSHYAINTSGRLDQISSTIATSASDCGAAFTTTLARIDSVADHSTTQHQITQMTLAKIEHVLQRARASEFKAKYELERSCWLVPYPKNERFYGRDELLLRMESSLVSSFTTNRPQFCSFTLYGLPGVGKTHTALEFVYRCRSHFRAVFWISAASVEKIIQGCRDIATSLGFPDSAPSRHHTQVLGDVTDWLRHTKERWLIVLDNADDLAVLKEFCPRGDYGGLIVTSQSPTSAQDWTRDGDRVEPFSPEDGSAFFKSLLPASNSADGALKSISERLGHLPLAINQMATFIYESECTIAEFETMYADREKANAIQTAAGSATAWYEKTVGATYDILMGKLGENARLTLEILAFYDPDKIPVDLLATSDPRLQALSDEVTRHNIIKGLRRWSLVSNVGTGKNLLLHRLVQDAALRCCYASSDGMQTSFNRALILLRHAFPSQSPSRDHMTESWPICESYLPHVAAFHSRYLDLAKRTTIRVTHDFADMLYNCSWYLFERGRFDLALSMAATAESICQNTDLQDHGLLLADVYSVYGAIYIELNRMEPATEQFDKAMAIREKAVVLGALEADHPNRANSYMNAGVSHTDSNTRKAIELHQQALKIRHSSDRFTRIQASGLALNYLNIGRCWLIIGELENARKALQTCLTGIRLHGAATNTQWPLTAWALWSLGNIAISSGDMSRALCLHTESMELLERTLGPQHLKTAACYHKIGWLLYKQNQHDKAKELLNLALSVYEGKEKDGVHNVRGEIARTKYVKSLVAVALGLEDEAFALKEEAGTIHRTITGSGVEEDITSESYDLLVAYFYR